MLFYDLTYIKSSHTEYVSDIGGFIYQHFFYSPFGEALVSQHANSGRYDTEFRFNGKEQDPETGLYYYGARYYNPRYSIWMSVDPLHAFRSWVTPYNYVRNNPVNLIDPTGMIDVDHDPPGRRLPEGNPNYGMVQFPEGGLEGPPQKIDIPALPTPEVPGGIDPSNIPLRTPATTPTENNVDWGKVASGTVTTIGGGAATVFGVMGILSGVASPAGVAGVTFGVPTMGLGMATMIDGFQGGKQKFPSGPLEATDIGFGGDGSVGQILDVFSGGFPRNAASGLFMGYGLYNSNIGRAMLNPPLIAPQPPSGSMPYIAPRDNTNVAMPIIRF